MADPNCRWCHGSATLPLFTGVVPCECVTTRPAALSWLPHTLHVDPWGATFHGPQGSAYCVHLTGVHQYDREHYVGELVTPWTADRLPDLSCFGVPPVGAVYPGRGSVTGRLVAIRYRGRLLGVPPQDKGRFYHFDLFWK